MSCTNLSSITLPPSASSLGAYCFSYCSSLTSITLPSSVTEVGGGCFGENNNLGSVYCYAVTPPTAGGTTFGCPSAILYVPSSSIDDYKQAKAWTEFSKIVSISGTACEKPTVTYTNGELCFESATPNAEYHYTLTCKDVTTDAYSQDGKVALDAAYGITAYATADGYTPSEKTTATLYWTDKGMGSEDGIILAQKRAIVISAQDGFVTVSGLENGEKVSSYSASGSYLSAANASGGIATASFATGQTVVVKIGQNSFKVSL